MKKVLLLALFGFMSHVITFAQDFCDAETMVKRIGVGWNLGNALEAYNGPDDQNTETSWFNPRTTHAMIDSVKAAGFNCIRIPVRWYPHFINSTPIEIDRKWVERVKEVIGYCYDNDMIVILNTHHELWLEQHANYRDSAEVFAKERELWSILAKEFCDYDGRLMFAGANEVHEENNWGTPTNENVDVQNRFNQIFVDVVRASGGNNLKRNLIVQTYLCNGPMNLPKFIKPIDSVANHLLLELHYYSPELYVFLGKEKYWGEPFASYKTPINVEALLAQFPDADPQVREAALKKYEAESKLTDEQRLANALDNIKQMTDAIGLPVIVGEWGAYRWNQPDASDTDPMKQSRAHYYKTMVSMLRERGMAPIVWDNGSIFKEKGENFAIFDRHNGMRNLEPMVTNAMMSIIWSN